MCTQGVWQPSLDTYLAVQMDHIKVRENYRVWHGVSHMDDARQAPVNYTHFDGYSMGASSDSPFAAGEHIPGLNRGGWYDAGDYDMRTQTQAEVITDLVDRAGVPFTTTGTRPRSTRTRAWYRFTGPTACRTSCSRSGTACWRCSPNMRPSATPFPASSNRRSRNTLISAMRPRRPMARSTPRALERWKATVSTRAYPMTAGRLPRIPRR
jgi:hypothetical protein